MKLRYIFIAFCLLCTSLLLTAQTNENTFKDALISNRTIQDTIVGGMGVTVGVSAMGGATCSIPIEVPLGVNGMQPNISIVYNSQSGNGMCGYGTNMAGLSSITRGPKEIYHDNAARGMKYFGDDAFYLDGVRLILDSGTSGQDGAIYYPETDPFTKVTLHGTCYSGTNYMWFEVRNKSGVKVCYGSSTGRQKYYVGGAQKIITWNLDYMIDSFGNELAVDYDTAQNVIYPKAIRYGMNNRSYNPLKDSVTFTYESRPDVTYSKFDGVNQVMDRRLKAITTKTGDSIYRRYTLNYNTTGDGTARKFSRLVSVTEENSQGETLPSTLLNWSYLPTVCYSANNLSVTLPSNLPDNLEMPFQDQKFYSGDLNGDGYSDIVGIGVVNNRTFANIYYRTIENGSVNFKTSGSPHEISNESSIGNLINTFMRGDLIIDIDGNGVNEQVVPYCNWVENDYARLFFYVIGQDFDSKWCSFDMLRPSIPVLCTGDINNDGKSRVLALETASYIDGYRLHIYRYNTQYSSYSNNILVDDTYRDLSLTSTPRQIFLADMNGNGMNDLMVICDNGYNIYWNQGGSTLFSEYAVTTSSGLTSKAISDVGDFNGDGLLDIIAKESESDWYVYYNKGDGYFIRTLVLDSGLQNTSLESGTCHIDVIDFDCDGLSDVVITEANVLTFPYLMPINTHTYWLRSTGTSLAQVCYANSDRADDALTKRFVTGDFDGDGRMELANYGYDCVNSVDADSDPVWRIYKNSNLTVQSGKVTSITGDFGATTGITYSTLADTTVYTRGNADSYPAPKYTIPLHVVKQTIHSNGAASSNRSVQYRYAGLKVHLQGRGLLGFNSVSNTDSSTGTVSESGILQWNTTYYIPSATYSKTTTGGQTARTENHMDIRSKDAIGYYSFPTETFQTDMDGYTTQTIRTYNISHGYLTSETVKYDGWNMYRSVTYSNFVQTAAGVYLPKRIEKEQKHADDIYYSSIIDTCFYNLTTGAMLKRVQNVGTVKPLTTQYTYDTWGNVKSVKNSGSGIAECTTYYTFDDTRRYTTRIHTYPESNVIMRKYTLFGDMQTETDSVNASIRNTTRYTYDGWGNLTRTVMPDNSVIIYRRGWNNDAAMRYYVRTEGTARPSVKTWYDNLGREVLTESVGIMGTNIVKATSYNTKGQVQSRTETEGSLSLTYGYQYDDRGRVIWETAPGSNVKTYTYSANGSRKIITVNDNGRSTTTVYDAWGKVKSITSPESGTVTNTYDSNGGIYTTESGGATWEFWYDDRGNRIGMEDPDAGVTEYEYDALGRETKRTDGRGVVFLTNYDYLGRVTSVSATQLGQTETITYTYGGSTSGVGQMRLISESNGTWTKSYTYDGLGRVTRETMSKGNTISKSRSYTYDSSNGLLTSRTMPGGKTVQYTYDAYGNTTGVDFESGTIEWSLTGYNGLRTTSDIVLDNYASPFKKTIVLDQYGHLDSLKITQTLQYGVIAYQDEKYIFDPIRGNLMQRQGVYDVTSIRYSYDSTDRLLTATDTYNNQLMAVTYAANGNITSKTGIGSYTYGNTSKPHAVAEVDNTNGSISHNYQEVSYNSWGKMSGVWQTDATDFYNYSVEYGPDLQRVESSLDKTYNNLYHKFYWDDYEEKTTGSLTTRYWYINGPDGLIGIYIEEQTPSGTVSMSTLAITDHLGSIEELCGNNNGHFFGARYDEWGNREKVFSYYLSDDIDRGFCGHEHIEELGLINMNGRMYDPLLGRFLSPDPFVQAPENPQNYNRYSYCLNNPLKYTDPSGELFWEAVLIGAAVFGTGNLLTHSIRGDVNSFCDGFLYFTQGALAGAALGATWYLAPSIPVFGNAIQSYMTYSFQFKVGMTALSTVSGLARSVVKNDWSYLSNSLELFLGNFYIDENAGFWEGILQGYSRHTWESLQTGLGHTYSQARNIGWNVSRVDYMAGATFATTENSKKRNGVTMGNYININIKDNITDSFEKRVLSDPLFMHEYGHTIDSREYGLSYLFSIGIQSLRSVNYSNEDNGYNHSWYWTELRANRAAKKYFGRYYGVNWSHYENDITSQYYYPIVAPMPKVIRKYIEDLKNR